MHEKQSLAGKLWDQTILWTIIGTIGYVLNTSYHLDLAIRTQLEIGRESETLLQEKRRSYYPSRGAAGYASLRARQREQCLDQLREDGLYHLKKAINPFAVW